MPGGPGGAGGALAGAFPRRAVAAPGVTFTPGPDWADFDPRSLPAVSTERSIPGSGGPGGRRGVPGVVEGAALPWSGVGGAASVSGEEGVGFTERRDTGGEGG